MCSDKSSNHKEIARITLVVVLESLSIFSTLFRSYLSVNAVVVTADLTGLARLR